MALQLHHVLAELCPSRIYSLSSDMTFIIVLGAVSVLIQGPLEVTLESVLRPQVLIPGVPVVPEVAIIGGVRGTLVDMHVCVAIHEMWGDGALLWTWDAGWVIEVRIQGGVLVGRDSKVTLTF